MIIIYIFFKHIFVLSSYYNKNIFNLINEKLTQKLKKEIKRKVITYNVTLSSYRINLHDNFGLKILITIDHDIYTPVLKI